MTVLVDVVADAVEIDSTLQIDMEDVNSRWQLAEQLANLHSHSPCRERVTRQ